MALQTVRKGRLEYLVAEGISVPHAFTTRLGGVSEGYLESLNIGFHRGDDPSRVLENYEILGNALGFSPENMVLANQIHSGLVLSVGAGDCRGIDSHDYPTCDGLVTREEGVALVVFTADCTPILLWDPVTGAVGALHAGWRGTTARIARRGVEAMAENYGCRPENIRAAIGPNIGPCCFETDADVPAAVEKALGPDAGRYIRPRGAKFHVDLKGVNAHILRQSGVRHIEISTECTACNPDRYWSHRIVGSRRGSQGAVILCKGEPK